MVGYRKGAGGNVHPVIGRKSRIFTVLCNKCRSFAPAAGRNQFEANEQAENVGWIEVKEGYGICNVCQEKEGDK